MQAAVDAGVTVVNSEGNEGPGQGTMGSAPDAPGLIAVGASTGNREFSQIGFMVDGTSYKGDQVITWSSRGPNSDGVFRPDIMGFGAYGWALAPSYGSDEGINIQEFGGTSMAAPVVAGDLALAECAWKLAHPGKTLPKPGYWKKLLASTATDLGYPALDQSTGLVNAEAAVKAVLHRGKSMLVSVAADGRTPCSWSPKVAEGAKKSTTVTIKNTGNAKETVSLKPTAYVADAAQTITKTVTLDGSRLPGLRGHHRPQWHGLRPDHGHLAVGPGRLDPHRRVRLGRQLPDLRAHLRRVRPPQPVPDLAQGPQGPAAGGRLRLAVDAGHLPARQHDADRGSAVNVKIEFLHKANWGRLSLSRTKVSLAKGQSRQIKATVKVPGDYGAGTYFGGIRVGNGSTVTTVPVSLRVPVTLVEGDFGTFQGKLTGSTIEYFGGEFYFYDVNVPQGASSIDAQVTWPDEGNLVNVYLVDPDGRVRDAKGGDLWSSDYSASPWVPAEALARTAEQVVWADPAPGRWQLIVWAPGFSGNGFSEPYQGVVTVTGASVEPGAWTATAAPGETATMDFTVTNDGPTDLDAYAGSTATYNGEALFQPVWEPDFLNDDPPLAGSLPGAGPSGTSLVGFSLPQNVQQVTAIVNWDSPATLLDLGLYDPTGTDVAESIASTTQGNAVQVQDPMAGDWLLTIAYADPTDPATAGRLGALRHVRGADPDRQLLGARRGHAGHRRRGRHGDDHSVHHGTQ